MRTIPLIKANLKGFVRNWKSVVLLIVLPLALISIIFASFNPDGLRKIDIGYSFSDEQTLGEEEFRSAVETFANLNRYAKLEDCKGQLALYHEYVCVHISGTGPYVLDVYYDNTREPVIWEIIERIKQSVRHVQNQHSRDIAADFLTRFRSAMGRLEAYESSLDGVNGDLNGYVREVDTSISQLQNARRDLISTLTDMDSDIADAKQATSEARYEKDRQISMAENSLGTADYYVNTIVPSEGYTSFVDYADDSIDDARNQLNVLDNNIDDDLDDVSNRINNYEQASARGKQYANRIQTGISQLSSTRSDLKSYQDDIEETQDELDHIHEEFSALQRLDAETLVNPVVIHNIPNYVPNPNLDPSHEITPEEQVKGFSFIALQTIFPTVLILITLFLSLLIGSFVTLNEVNQRAHKRIQLVPGSFFAEFLATFFSSFVIVAIPVIIVVLIGNGLFKLGIFMHFLTVLLIVGMTILFFVMLGMLLSYLIRKESMTLMTSTFVLILTLFLSGFLLPIERMSPLLGTLASISPGTLALESFKKAVFYNASLSGILGPLILICMSALVLFILTLVIKHLRD